MNLMSGPGKEGTGSREETAGPFENRDEYLASWHSVRLLSLRGLRYRPTETKNLHRMSAWSYRILSREVRFSVGHEFRARPTSQWGRALLEYQCEGDNFVPFHNRGPT